MVTAKGTLLWLAGTVTEPGTVSIPLLLLSEITEALAAALVKVTVQVVDALLPKVEGEQDTEES